ncbi:7TM diverse intracellular signaling domain-containing protein [Hugenholtzia roseola]|uniref:7TM diverse intracellular signaling domain-containing protein n=1 Tax=Hugenholtzia roseola TaxID=1002 RepID=UPI00040C2CA7|nr:7TM diverse intracellular signaling domain-containing protein [Hugenholtzia roseola]
MLQKKIYLILLLLSNFHWLDAQSIVLTQEQTSRDFEAGEFYLYPDSAFLQKVEAVAQKPFAPNQVAVPSLGYVKVPIWVRFEVENQSSHTDWVLHYNWVFSDTVELYAQDAKGIWQLKYRAGYTLPFQNRPLDYPSLAYPLGLEKGQKATFYVRVWSAAPIGLPFSIKRPETLQAEQRRADLLYGIYFGTLIVMLLYNLAIWISLRDRSYLYYTFTIVSTLAIFSSISGYTGQFLFYDYPKVNAYFAKVFIGLIVITTVLFANEFLNTKKYAPIFVKIFRLMMLLAGISILHVFYDTTSGWSNKVVSLHTPLLLAVGIWVWYKGNQAARFFVLAWSFYIVGGLIITLSNSGVLPATGIYRHLAEVGSALEVVLLSLALSDRYRMFKKEKEEAQKQALLVTESAKEELEEKVKQRTKEIYEKNEELIASEEEIRQQADELMYTLQVVEAQKSEIEKKNENITASITYALRIQNAILPKEADLQTQLNGFVFFKPKDIVSGDFYWFAQKENCKILAVADCTGHGVSGAFMTMIGNNILNQIVHDLHIYEPDLILNKMQFLLEKTLSQAESKVADGMDIAIIKIEQKAAQQVVTYSGAMNPLYYVQNQELKEIKASKKPIGGKTLQNFSYQRHEIKIETETTFYLLSDGFQDQFGGADNKKFMTRNLKKLLVEIEQKPLSEQKDILATTFEDWKGDEKQTDDVCIVGLKIAPK